MSATTQPHSPPPPAPYIEAGSPAFRRANLAMFLGGFTTFAMLYATQPILPRLADDFAVAPSTASLSVSLGTAALAAGLIPASVLSDRFGRTRLMRIALALATFAAVASAFATDFAQLLAFRVLLGLALAGLPAAAMAYLGEEISPKAQGQAMGLYIAGNSLGGMSGRFLVAALTDWSSWRIALAVLAVIGVVATVVFCYILPPSHHFRSRTVSPTVVADDALTLLRDPGQWRLFAIAFLMMGAFTSVYNYLGFRLQHAPFLLGQTAIGAVFLMYLVGTASSAWTGKLVDRIGRRAVLWTMTAACGLGLGITLGDHLVVVLIGLALFTFAYFGAHTAASGWVGRRAGERRALGAALYLCSYYLGSSVIGTASGIALEGLGWRGVVGSLAFGIGLALILALKMRSLQPLPAAPLGAPN